MHSQEQSYRFGPKGSIQKKKKSQIMEKVQKGGGISSKNQKVQNSKFGLFDKRGRGPNFHFFPKFKCTL